MEALIEKTVQHKEHQLWLSQLNFYQDEVKIFQNTLLLVLYRHPNSLSCVEHVDEYRRILLKKIIRIDELRYSVICHEKALSQETLEDLPACEEHHKVGAALKIFIEDFEKMKRNLRGFIAHND